MWVRDGDIIMMADGELFLADEGNFYPLRIASGSGAPVVIPSWTPLNDAAMPSFMLRLKSATIYPDGVGRMSEIVDVAWNCAQFQARRVPPWHTQWR